jgi:phosphoribosyl 1,2-cyclic phosphodiesterase
VIREAVARLTGRHSEFYVRFWGVRGSIACGGTEYAKYGGNTSCVEINAAGRTLIFDGGTGIRELGDQMAAHPPVDADIFLSHSHVDHIVGLPFFSPFYDQRNTFRVWSGHLNGNGSTKFAIHSLMAAPIFPVDPAIFTAVVTYRDFKAGDSLGDVAPGVVIRTAALNHPNGATGYRVEVGDKAIAYVTDTEHKAGELDKTVIDLAHNADIMIYDATYTDEEYPEKVGYGHSTWQEGIKVAVAAKAKLLILFHHDPSHTDKMMDRITREAVAAGKAAGLKVDVAREGMMLKP